MPVAHVGDTRGATASAAAALPAPKTTGTTCAMVEPTNAVARRTKAPKTSLEARELGGRGEVLDTSSV